MEITTFLILNAILTGLLFVIWKKSDLLNIAIKAILFADCIGSIIYLVKGF